MPLFDRYFRRQQDAPHVSDLSPAVRRRLTRSCDALTAAEAEIARRLDLPSAPRLLMIDEEEAVIVTPEERRLIEEP
ncbi:hypothetical protein [Phenylobacterium sp.]|uniref:hypothetical protein n=1 Tax=Phenylobacterium sp. TaxID=1871053 RepID=UPI0026031895|nr:hypothetical protein [Phenylobacterium sp.]